MNGPRGGCLEAQPGSAGHRLEKGQGRVEAFSRGSGHGQGRQLLFTAPQTPPRASSWLLGRQRVLGQQRPRSHLGTFQPSCKPCLTSPRKPSPLTLPWTRLTASSYQA